MDKGYVERIKTELYASEKVYEQAQADWIQARKVLAKAEETLSFARTKVDTCKNMLISALSPE